VKIKKIEIENFKSFRSVSAEIRDFQIILGANAAGKSNFVEALNFLREIENQGLENAISLQGGIEYLTNLREGKGKNVSIAVSLAEPNGFRRRARTAHDVFLEYFIESVTYRIAIATRQDDHTTFIPKESMDLNIRIRNVASKRQLSFDDQSESLMTVGLIVDPENKKHSMNRISVSHPEKTGVFNLSEVFPEQLFDVEFPDNKSMLESPAISYLFNGKIFDGVVAYDFEPKTSKRATRISSRADLETDGNNASIVLKNILANPREYQRFSNLIRDLLPFVDGLEMAPTMDKSISFKIREIFAKEKYLPSILVSDGTINVITLIIALFFQEKDVLIFEEPERNLHPALISKIIQMMRDRSRSKQIIVTTHSTEMIRNAKIDEILFVSRDQSGSSIFTLPSEKKEVRKFLENEIGLDELYISNLLS